MPFFFAITGAKLDLSALLDPPVAALAITLAVLGITLAAQAEAEAAAAPPAPSVGA